MYERMNQYNIRNQKHNQDSKYTHTHMRAIQRCHRSPSHYTMQQKPCLMLTKEPKPKVHRVGLNGLNFTKTYLNLIQIQYKILISLRNQLRANKSQLTFQLLGSTLHP